MSTPDCDCGTYLGGFHALSCARYANVEDNWMQPLVIEDTHEAVDDATGHSCSEVDDILPRLKELLADTQAMVVRTQALLASMRDPSNHFRRY